MFLIFQGVQLLQQNIEDKGVSYLNSITHLELHNHYYDVAPIST